MIDASSTDGEPPQPTGSFRIGVLRVDLATGAIDGPGGSEQVDPRVIAVLAALSRSPHQLVSRADLLESIWPGGTIYDDTLTQCVYQLRQHLAAAGGSDEFRELVRTLPKRGYLLACDVEPVTPDPVGDARRRLAPEQAIPWVLAAAILAAAFIGWWLLPARSPDAAPERHTKELLPNTVAVLPFLNTSPDDESDYLSDGVADGLRDRIAADRELRVVARRSSVQFRDAAVDTREVGRQLGVGRIVEGRFHRDGGRITIAVELVDTNTGFQLWSGRYEPGARDLMQIERDLYADLMRQLSPGRAEPPELQAASAEALAAHDLILLGREHEQELSDQQVVDEALLNRTIDLYSRAAATDASSAEAQARLGRLLLYQGRFAEAEEHILAALRLDPERSDAYASLGLYYWATRQDGSGAAYRRAIELNPSDAEALSYYASWSWLQGDSDRAVVYYRAALDVDPLSLVRYADLGYKLAFQGSRDEALAVLSRIIELFPDAPGYLAAARLTEALGDLDEAIAWAIKAQQLRPDDADIGGQVAELLARVDAFEEARWFEPEAGLGKLFWQRRYAELVDQGELLTIDRPGDVELVYLVAFAHSALGHHQQAVDWYERAGMPGNALSESRRAGDVHALHAYMGDLQRLGREAEAIRLAQWAVGFNRSLLVTEGIGGWLPHLAEACSRSVLGETEAALESMETMSSLETLPRLPWLLDWSCLDPLKAEPRYREVVKAVKTRMGELRAGIPAALARHGIEVST